MGTDLFRQKIDLSPFRGNCLPREPVRQYGASERPEALLDDGWAPASELARPLEGPRESEDVGIAVAPPDDLQANRQPAGREPARHADRRQAGAADRVARRHPVDVRA